MTREDRRSALLSRFRVAALERIAGMIGRLHGESMAEPEPDLAALRGDLHTLKGEARMLGLPSLAELVHAIEDGLADAETIGEPEALARVRCVVELLGERIAAPLVEDRDAEQALVSARAILAGEARSEVGAAQRTSNPEPGLSLVDTATLDQLCERLEQLRASLHRLGPGLPGVDPLRVECGELTELAWSLRMVAVEPVLRSLAQHAEQLATRLGKQVRVEVDAGGAELERSLLERLREPLLHLVHNAIDHGIEAKHERGSKPPLARLCIATRSLGRELEFVVVDDGRGIDRDRVRARAIERGLIDSNAALAGDDDLLALLFTSGFSTAARVGELSGRGVGLDVVRRVVESLGGNVEVRSEPDRTTEFTLRVPATISRERVVVIEFGRALWGLPARRVGPILALREPIIRDSSSATVIVDGQHLPLLSLAGLLGLPDSRTETIAICCTHGDRRHALASPGLLGEYELFRLPLGPTLASVGPASASAMLDDGRLVLLVEPSALLRARRPHQARYVPRRPPRARPRVLVVDDSAIVRELLVELLAASSLEVEADEDGQAALERLDQARFDLVVTDIEMPRLDGFELLTRIRERHGDLPVIVASTRASSVDRQRAVALGADAYIVKSEFTEHNLLDAVERFVEVVR